MGADAGHMDIAGRAVEGQEFIENLLLGAWSGHVDKPVFILLVMTL
jgi:hypothetical protein